jgi:hypothetical protein
MSGARAATVRLTAEQLAAWEAEQKRQQLARQVRALGRQRASLARRAESLGRAYDIAPPHIRPVGDVDEDDTAAMAAFIAEETERTVKLEQALQRLAHDTRQAQGLRVMQGIAAAAGGGADPRTTPTDPSARVVSPVESATQPTGDADVPADHGLEDDLAEAVDIVARLDDRATAPDWVTDLLKDLRTTDPRRRPLLLEHLGAEVEALNAAAAERELLRTEFDQLSQRAAELGGTALTSRAARADADLRAGRPVDLAPLREAVAAAESAHLRRSLEKHQEMLVVAAFERRGYQVLSGVGLYTADGGVILRRKDPPWSRHGVAVHIEGEQLRVSTVHFQDPSSGGATEDPRVAEREAICTDITEVYRTLPDAGLRLGAEPVRTVSEDEVVLVPRGLLADVPPAVKSPPVELKQMELPQ